MANKNLFASIVGRLLPKADVVNEAGGRAYAFSPEHALAQYAATGCLNGTFYATAEAQLDAVLALASKVEPRFLAQAAIHARQRGRMKDMPALLLAVLSVRDPRLFAMVFDRVVDDAKMLRTFVQIVRSGAVGRKSLGTRPKKQILAWLEARSDEALFRASVGNDPSLADVLKMVHPKPSSDRRRALYGYLIGKPHDAAALPALVQRFEQYKRERSGEPPDVPFRMLTALGLGTAEWTAIAKAAGWQTTRMNLNTFARHGVFADEAVAELVAARLADPALVAKARAFPYQLMMAYLASGPGVPAVVEDALQAAMEHALSSVPAVDGHVWVCPDVSGSMHSPVTGWRKGATTTVRCVDVAALFAAAMLRTNPRANVLPFQHAVVSIELNPRDSVMTNAAKLAKVGGGGTNVSAPLAKINAARAPVDLVVVVSDNQSWVDVSRGASTETLEQWELVKRRCPRAKLVCVDVTPYAHTQAPDRDDILNVGGFSDAVFEVVAAFASGEGAARRWVELIEAVEV